MPVSEISISMKDHV